MEKTVKSKKTEKVWKSENWKTSENGNIRKSEDPNTGKSEKRKIRNQETGKSEYRKNPDTGETGIPEK